MITDTTHDPVCHMDIDPKTAAGTSEYEGTTYYFCGRGCKMDFDEDPAGVLKAEAEYDHSQPSSPMMTMTPDEGQTKKPWWQFWA
jgi:YHS domain-containing protein